MSWARPSGASEKTKAVRNAVEERDGELAEVERRRERERQQVAEQALDQERQGPPTASPIAMPSAAISITGRGRGRRPAARRAEALQRGEGLALAVDEAAHRIGDADAADEQRRQPDQREE